MEKKYPMRINKYLAEEKHSTRRGADDLIIKGMVFVNGQPAKLGEMVGKDDHIEVRYRSGKKKEWNYYAYHKPRGVLTHSAGEGEQDINDVVNIKDVFPVGRLDKDSSGLIILTNDGRITERLLSPEHEHEKEYVVTVNGKLRPSFKEKMEAGVQIGSESTRECEVEILGDKKFKVVLTEGKNRQIRRMCAALFQEVETLKRVRVMNIELGDLKEGEWRKIEGEEQKAFLSALGLL